MKSIEEIYQQLLEGVSQRVGFTPADSCDLAVRLYAAASQLQALDIQADWVLDQSFPQTAQGIYLDYHGQMRGISRAQGTCAVGTLRFQVSAEPTSQLVIPAGTVCMTQEEVRFQTTADGTLGPGSLFVDVPAQALEVGSGGNVVAGAVCVMTACPVGITACTNPDAFSGGSDPEEDESLRARILESYQRLPNGANAAYYQQVAMSHTGVAAATVVGRARGIGTVDVYIATEAGLPDGELLEEVRQDLQEKREIAVDVQVLAPEAKTVDIQLQLDAGEQDFEQLRLRVEAALRTFFSGHLLGSGVLLAELGSLVYGVEGVKNYRFLSPTQDLTASQAMLPVLGGLTVTKMEA